MRMNDLRVCACALVLLALTVGAVDYSYREVTVQEQQRGPSRWGEIRASDGSPAYAQCQSGSAQSPIDISQHHDASTISGDLEALSITANGAVSTFTATTDGAQAYLSMDGTSLPQFSDPSSGSTLQLSNVLFRSPSDHSFGGGKRDFEIQLQFAQSGSTDISIVCITASAHSISANRELHKVLDSLPAPPPMFAAANTTSVEGAAFDVRKLLPASRQYATYDGALSYPPCTGGARYYVFVEPVTMSMEQLLAFRERVGLNNTASSGYAYHGNSRPVQGHLNLRFFLDESVDGGSFAIPSADKTPASVILERCIIAVVLALLGAIVAVKAAMTMIRYSARHREKQGMPNGAASMDASASSKYIKTS